MNNDKTDEQIAAIVAARNDSAAAMNLAVAGFEQLYERHSKLLLAFFSSRVARSNLEDNHQTVWQRIWQYLPGQFKGGNFRAWLYQIARNYLIDVSRKKKPHGSSEALESAASHEEPGAALLDEEKKEILQRCLEHLQQEMADIVRSRLAGEDYETICGRMELAPARAHKLFFQAREQLSGCVQKAME